MDQKVFKDLKLIVRSIEEKLVSGIYKIAESKLTEEEIKNAIENYPGPGKLSLSPLSELDKINPIEIKSSSGKSWAVDYDLWFDDKLGDLTLQLTASLDENNNLLVIIEDIHTL